MYGDTDIGRVYGVYLGLGTGWVPGRGIPPGGYYLPPTRLPLHWYCQGPTNAKTSGSASTRALQGALLAPLRTPWLLALSMPSWDQ